MPEERKLVTVLFADVSGSTALGDELDPEDLRSLLGRYYEHARQVIAAHDGTLEKFVGDAVMAVFGLPRAHGDDAERALAAALALRQAVEDDPLLPPTFRLRLGVNSGEVVATGDTSRGDFLVTGDAVNVAARLQQGAVPGEILVSERTMQATRSSFLFAPARELTVKGKPQPLRVYPLEAPRPRRLRELPPFVGRQRDLEQLQLLLDRACEEQRPYYLSLIGPAGSGKTRLLEAFLESLASRSGLRVVRASCPPYGQRSAVQPLRELLSGLIACQMACQTEPVPEIDRESLQQLFRESGYGQEEAVRLAGLILQSLGLAPGSSLPPESISGAWRQLLECSARRSPLLIIFDDLQHAPDSLLDLVEALLSIRASVPLLLVLLGRPELLERRRSWGAGRQNFLSLSLPPLTAGQLHQLLEGRAGALPSAVREAIVQRADGNPFFALELARGLLELQQQGRSLTESALPDTVHASLLARLDLLPAPARRLLQIASIAGQSAPRALLQAIFLQKQGRAGETGDTEEAAERFAAALDDLLLHELLVAEPDGTLALAQNLVRDVAYGTLARGERIRLHAQAAAWLEQTALLSEQITCELKAYHYREALNLARRGAVRQELPFPLATAQRAFEQAGLLAAQTGAFAEARDWLELAIELASPAEQVRLYELLGDSLYWGSMRRAAYEQALEHWRSLEPRDPLIGARLLRKIIIGGTRFALLHRLSPDEVARLGREALALAQQAKTEDEIWRLRVAICFGLIEVNNSLATFETQADLEELVISFTNVSTKATHSLSQTRELLEAMCSVLNEASDYFEQRGDYLALSEALDALGLLNWYLDRKEIMLGVAQRRLSLPALPQEEYIDAINVAAYSNLVLGNHQQTLALGKAACARGDLPLPLLSRTLSALAIASFLSGCWEEIEPLAPMLDAIREQIAPDQERTSHLADAYFCLFLVAQAREEPARCAHLAILLRSLLPAAMPVEKERGFQEALLQDDPQLMPVEGLRRDHLHLLYCLRFYNEHGLSTPQPLLSCASQLQSESSSALLAPYLAIAQALATNDLPALARAIDAAETAGHPPHAARMRLVLAERSGDRRQLERARPTLERLRDRRALRHLAEIEALLNNAPSAQSASQAD
ncbi:MAG: AAA family ATPase [Thermogemmatispora sp.]|uniref:adenylate/guanylate cyclase domain-containing protein n=1 Tax=Thermogemmatispora sp. TaxID=1968838 RepID=UPI00261D5D2F|nr:adenylate/guanylate cyclase domain-containing protein [Thermogemmatispora sp.]MBX5456674.1 AAA family ATPase [Thermogemmatispora sp.]